jgi:fatty-acyl-CoA synthase
VGKGYWQRPDETAATFRATLTAQQPAGSRAEGVPPDAHWLRTGDLGMFVDGELYVTGRIVDLLTIDGRRIYPQEIESTVADAAPLVRRGYLAAIGVPAGDGREELVIVTERATGTSRSDPATAADAIRAAVRTRHGLDVADIRILPAGAIPRTTSGKLARRACRTGYLQGSLKGHRL